MMTVVEDKPFVEWVAHGSPLYWSAVSLRQRELRDPLGLTFSYSELEEEAGQRHLVLVRGRAAIGSVSLIFLGEVLRIRQMVVDPEHRGKGHGATLLAAAEEEARRQGCRRIELHARCSAEGFYKRAGFVTTSEEYLEVTLPHVTMEKGLEGVTPPGKS